MVQNQKTKRVWTETELREVVAKSKSWRDVLRAFGYSVTSGAAKERIRRSIHDLNISTDHFRGQRRWSDEQLIRAARASLSWPELLREMKMPSGNPAARAMLRSHALRLELDLSALEREEPENRRSIHEQPARREQLRRAAPSIAAAWFLVRGIPIFVPVEPEPYDLVAECPQGFQKIQVKSCTRRDKHGSYLAAIAPRRTHGPNKDVSVPYDPKDVDQFFIVDADGWMHLIPLGVVAGYCAISLNAYKQFRCGRADGLLAGLTDPDDRSAIAADQPPSAGLA